MSDEAAGALTSLAVGLALLIFAWLAWRHLPRLIEIVEPGSPSCLVTFQRVWLAGILTFAGIVSLRPLVSFIF